MSGGARCYSVVAGAMDSHPALEPLQEVGCQLIRKFTAGQHNHFLWSSHKHLLVEDKDHLSVASC